jgi:type I restriction enzyme S subunit
MTLNCSLGDLIFQHKEKSTVDSQHRVATSSRKGLVLQEDYYRDSRLSKRDSSGFNVLPINALTYRNRSDDGLFTFNINTMGETLCVSKFYPIFFANEEKVTTEYLSFVLNSMKSTYIKLCVGTSQKVLSITLLKKIKINLPPLEEQRKIAACLSTWDKAIDAYDRLISLKVQQKRGLMQNVFSNSEYSKVKLGDVANIISGHAFKSKDFNGDSASVPVIRMSDFKSGSVNTLNSAKVHKDKIAGLDKFLLNDGDFIFGMSGSLSNYGWISKSSEGSYLNQRVGKITAKDKAVDNVFLSHLFLSKQVQKPLMMMAEGAAQLNISTTALKKIKVSIPPLKEQRKISACLSTWDNAIDALTKKRDLLKKQKQGLMQQLLR